MDIVNDKKYEFLDVMYVFIIYIGLKLREKVFISDFMINLSLYIRDSFLEIR